MFTRKSILINRSVWPDPTKTIGLCIIVVSICLSCPLEPHGTISIYDFETVPLNQPPPAPWTVGCITSYGGDDYQGVVVAHFWGDHGLCLLDDVLGPPGSYGMNYTGYTCAQIVFQAPAPGTLSFDFYHVGWFNDNLVDPAGTFEFWLDLDLADIEIAVNPDWEGIERTAGEFETCEIPVPGAGAYRLTWKIVKDWANQEDTAMFTNLRFVY